MTRGRKRINDDQYLMGIARIKIQDSNLSLRAVITAYLKQIGTPEHSVDTIRHRINGKWKKDSDRFLIAAKKELEQSSAIQCPTPFIPKPAIDRNIHHTLGGVTMIQSLADALLSPAERAWNRIVSGSAHSAKSAADLFSHRKAMWEAGCGPDFDKYFGRSFF